MILTNKQEEGLKIGLERYKNKEKYVTIAGYAGTGKSTLVKFLISALDIDKEKVAYATFTGKAAEVLRRKGNDEACTLHKLLYDHVPEITGGFIRKPKTSLNYKVVVVDEVSMVPKSIIELLIKHNVFIIFLGDPFQLSVLDKNESHNILDKPHVFLDEIMRQAEESEIIRMTMKIRAGEKIECFNGTEAIVIPKNELVIGHLTWADQIITATNAARNSVNKQMREVLGYSGNPQDGEKMICLRNYWDDYGKNGASLVNGMTGIVKNSFESFIRIPYAINTPKRKIETIDCVFESDDDIFTSVSMDKHMIETGEYSLDWKTAYQMNKMRRPTPKEFAYGYAITCHKAQGSEWDKVLVLEENFPFDKQEHAKWLYTACTRAVNKLVLRKGK